MKESQFQANTIKEIKARMPRVIVMKNDPSYRQGISDISFLWRDNKWALLEFKDEADAEHQPNQDTYVALANSYAFARFIYPENKEEVMREFYEHFGV